MKRHFTLIELVAATGILMLVIVIAGSALYGAQQTMRKVNKSGERFNRLNGIDRFAESALRHATAFHWRDRDNKEVILFEGRSDQLMFPYLHRADVIGDGAIRFIRLQVKDKQLICSYRNTPIVPETPQTAFTEEVIADEVNSIQFSYATYENNELVWLNEWDTGKNANIPIAIQMKIEFADGSREVWLRRTAGNSRYTEFNTGRRR